MSELRAGAGTATIRFPEEVWPLDGFTSQHDPLGVRVLVLDAEQRVVWVLVDMTALPPEPLLTVRLRVASLTGVSEASVIVGVTHTFSAPHLADPDGLPAPDALRMRAARDVVFRAVDSAAQQAMLALRPVTVGVGQARCRVNVNRDIETEAGWTLGTNDEGYSDESVGVLRIDDLTGAPLAVLLNYAVQPSIMNESSGTDGGRVVTADLAGAAMNTVETALPGAVAFFLIGAAGDQAPAFAAVRASARPLSTERVDLGEHGFALVDLLGERLGLAALRAAGAASPIANARVERLVVGELSVPGKEVTPREQFAPTRFHDYEPTADQPLLYLILVIGGTAIIGVQVELSAAAGEEIRKLSPFHSTFVVTMVDGGAKYLPEANAYDRFTYEALSSRYARGGAEELIRQLDFRLGQLHAQVNEEAR